METYEHIGKHINIQNKTRLFFQILALYGSWGALGSLKMMSRSMRTFSTIGFLILRTFKFLVFVDFMNFTRHLIFCVKSGLRTKPHPYQKIDLDLKFLVLSLIPQNLGSRTQTGYIRGCPFNCHQGNPAGESAGRSQGNRAGRGHLPSPLSH